MVLLFVARPRSISVQDEEDREEVLAMTAEALDYCKARGVPASVSAEEPPGPTSTPHAVLSRTEANGAVRVGVTDTLGCATPEATRVPRDVQGRR
jgi:isopropylmalate/homocitrate/citramalate synthase